MRLLVIMATIALISLANISLANSRSNDLKYIFQRRDSTSLQITFTFTGSQTGTTLLRLPNEWAGQQLLYKTILQLHAISRRTSVKATNKPYEYLVRYMPGSTVTLSYILKKDWDGLLKYPLYFRPVIENNLFYFEGSSGLVYPSLTDSLHVNCQIYYKGFPKNYFIANSYFANKTRCTFNTSLKNLLNSVFCAGMFRAKAVKSGTHEIVMATTGKFLFTDEEAFSNISKIILSERQFWKYTGPAYYFTLLMPLHDTGNSGGTAHYNSFSLFQSVDLKLSENLLQMIAHEYFHNWLGLSLTMPEPDEFYKWFSEGFTDYYALKLLHGTNIISKEDFVNRINEYVKDYYLSRYFTAPNQSLVGRYWGNPELKLLSYRRGLSIAFMLDNRIFEEKNGSLDDLIKSLYNQSKPSLIFSKKLFDNLVLRYAGRATLYAIDSTNNGNNKYLTKLLIANKSYQMDTLKVNKVFDIGFNFEASKVAGKIIGLEPGSNAEKAGIRENMKLTDKYSIWFNNTQKPAIIGVLRDNKKEELRYIPVSDVNIQIPQLISEMPN